MKNEDISSNEKINWSMLTETETLDKLKSSRKGLLTSEVQERVSRYGYNELKREKKLEAYKIFFNQFKSFIIITLIVAGAISFILNEVIDGSVIFVVILINAFLGFAQEYKANKAIEELRKITSLKAIVLRNSVKTEVDSKELVPGDIIYLEEGRQVPADLRLISSNELFIDESLLTGESVPVLKKISVLKKQAGVSEQENMAFMGTNISRGTGLGIVIGTGKNTEVGNIAAFVQKSEKESSPLKTKLEKFGKILTYIILGLIAVLLLSGVMFEKIDLFDMFLISVSLAVSAIPEGLPAVVTLALALGMQVMAKNKALVNRLMAVETLGSTSVICSDKTGTLTKNEMTVRKIWIGESLFDVSGTGYEPVGEFHKEEKKVDANEKYLNLLLISSSECSNATVFSDAGNWKIIGDPTEGALVVAAMKFGINITNDNKLFEVPFTSERKLMSVVFKEGKFAGVRSKGAPENVLSVCTHAVINNKVVKLNEKIRNLILSQARLFASQSLRVLGIATKGIAINSKYNPKDVESKLTFIGLVGMEDPPREEVAEAIKKAHNAGIKTVMITGDHLSTAIAVAKQIGLMHENDLAVTGDDIEKLGEEEFDRIVGDVAVYARVSPETKVRILEGLKKKGHVVAMTGDGINDAPALRRADIGVAMGLKGTDVAKSAGDLILEDDNYSTIITAVHLGRTVYSNILKFLRQMLAMNFTEVGLIAFTIFAGLPLPLLPLQLLWINLITDALPALALAVDPPESDLMKRKPRSRTEGIFTSSFVGFVLTAGILITLAEIALFVFYLGKFELNHARTIVFTFSVMSELFFAFNCRSEDKSVWEINPFSNMKLVGAVALSIALQMIVVYVPFMQNIFSTTPLSIYDMGIILSCSLVALVISPKFFVKKEKRVT